MIKLIASDLDGTLLQNGAQDLTPEVIDFIEKLATEHGIIFVAASGRQYPNLKRLFGKASKHMAFICENGAVVFYRDKLLCADAMDCEVAMEICRDILAADGCEALISGLQTSYLVPKEERFVHRIKHIIKNDTQLLQALEEMPEDFYKVSVYEISGIKEGHGPYFIEKHSDKAKCTISGRGWLDFVRPDVHKGSAMQHLQEVLNISPDECAAFGDNYNDLEMLDCVKYGYVMDNAVEEIRSRYQYHCKDVVTAIREELLKK